MNATLFLVNTVFELYLTIILLRIWLQMARADFYNPFSQFIVKATNPVVVPLRRLIPGFGGLDLGTILFALAFSMLHNTVMDYLMYGGMALPFITLLLKSVLAIVGLMLTLIMYALVIRAILSWISQGFSPIEALLGQLTEPFVGPIRRILPPMGGLDLSPMVAILAIIMLKTLLFQDLIPMLNR